MKKNLFKNKFGFGLVEVLMAAGIAGGIALTIAKLSQDANKVTKSTEANNEINMFITDAAYILSDKDNCKESLIPFPATSIPAAGSVIQRIAKKPPAATPIPIYQTGNTYGNNLFRISRMETEFTTPDTVNLRITVERTNVTTLGAKSIIKKIPLKAVMSGTNMVGCFSDTENMIEDAARAACHGNSARWDSVNKQCHHDILVSPTGSCPAGQALKAVTTGTATIGDTATFTCQPVQNALTCATGSYIKGFNVDGSANCQPLSTACAVGQYLRQNNTGSLDCVSIPSCNANQVMYTRPDGSFGCSDSTCGPNQYLQAINSNGMKSCKTVPNGQCGSGMYVKEVTANGTLICEHVPSSASGSVAAHQYLAGFNTDGSLIGRNYPTCPLNNYLTFDGSTFYCRALPTPSAWSPDSNGVSGTNTFRNQINGSNSSYVSLEISNSAMGNSEARLQLDGGGGYDFKIGSIAYNASASSFSSYGEPGGGYIGGANTKSIGINTHFVPYVMYSSRIPTLGLSTRRWSAIYLSSNPNVSSDLRLKNSVRNSRLGLDFINGLHPVEYKLNESDMTINHKDIKFGLIAQEVEKVLLDFGVKKGSTEIVTKDEKGFYGMTYTALISPIIKAIQELSEKVENLFNGHEKAIRSLEERMIKLEKENRALKEELKKAPR